MNDTQPKAFVDHDGHIKSVEARAFISAEGNIVVVGFDAWNKATYIEGHRLIPENWTPLVPMDNRGGPRG